jgi:hypothetical protein
MTKGSAYRSPGVEKSPLSSCPFKGSSRLLHLAAVADVIWLLFPTFVDSGGNELSQDCNLPFEAAFKLNGG